MGQPPLERIEDLFHRAADLAEPERSEFLTIECAGDGVLRAAVEELLLHDADLDPTEAVAVSPIERLRQDPLSAETVAGYQGPVSLPREAPPGYQLIEVLGSGGMGVVFKARQLSLGRLVALKMLLAPAGLDADQLARFRAEANALSLLQHPNIVQIFEIGQWEGRPFLIMEFVRGPNLARYLEGRPQPARFAAELIHLLARTIQVVHEAGIIHRDLKPANILVVRVRGQGAGAREEEVGIQRSAVREEITDRRSAVGKDGIRMAGASSSVNPDPNSPTPILKITDFGLAKQMGGDSRQTGTGVILGTPSYMPPEQARGRLGTLGPAIDIYALGAILYELLTGRPPFWSTSPEETIQQVLSEEPVSPATLRPTLPRDLVTICLKCLEKEPAKRYGSAAALSGDLACFLADKPILARPVGAVERAWRWCRRRPAVAALTAISALLAVALIATVITYQSVLIRRTEQNLQSAEGRAQENGQLAEEERKQLSRLDRALGAQELEHGDAFAALLYLAEALRLDHDDPDHERRDRIGISLALQQCPRLLGMLACGHPVLSARLSPSGCWLALRVDAETIEVSNVLGEEKWTFRGAVERWDPSPLIAISPSGKLLAVSRHGDSMEVWSADSATGPVARLLRAHSPARAVFSEDSTALAIQLSNGGILVWTLPSGKQADRQKISPQLSDSIVLSDNGGWDFALSPSGVGQVRSLPRVKSVGPPLRFAHGVAVAAVSSDGMWLALVDALDALWICDVASGNEKRLIPSLHNEGHASELHWSPDNRMLLVIGGLHQARVWDAKTGTPLTPPLNHAGPLLSAGFAGNGRVLTIGNDGQVRIWELPRARETAIEPEAEFASMAAPVSRASSDRFQLAAGPAIRVKQPRTSGPLRPYGQADELLEHAVFSSDGSRVVIAEPGEIVRIWNRVTGKALTDPLPHKAPVHCAAFSPDDRHLITASAERIARIWDSTTGEPIGFPLRFSRDIVRVLFAAEGDQIVVVLKGGFRSTWQLRPSTVPREDLRALARVLAWRAITDQGLFKSFDAKELRLEWQRLTAGRSASLEVIRDTFERGAQK